MNANELKTTTRWSIRLPRLLRRSFTCLPLGLACIAASPFGRAQPAEGDAAVVELSPFEVDGSKDDGYRAENTLSGSRMNMSLQDVAQNISVLTAEFLEDIGAESIDDILLYTLNGDDNHGDNKPEGTQQEQVGSEISFNPNGFKNIRGQGASITVDHMSSGGSIDTYNTSRVEVSQGPNAILFGFGGAGGLINISTQTAQTQRRSIRLQNTIGSNGKSRNVININQPLIKDRLGFRVISLFDDSDGWRASQWSRQRRNTFILSFKAAEGTDLNFSYENGHVDGSYTIAQGAIDGYLEWAGLYQSDAYQERYGAGTDAVINLQKNRNFQNANGINHGRNQRSLLYVDNLDFEAHGLPTGHGNLLPILNNPNSQPLRNARMFSGEEIDIADFTPFGPEAYRKQNIKNFKASLTQRILPNLYFDLSFFNSKNNAFDQSPDGRDLQIKAEIVNVWDGIADKSPLDGIANPFGPTAEKFWLFSEENQVRKNTTVDNEVLRATLGYKFDTERFGSHHIGAAAFREKYFRSIIKDLEVIDIYTARENGVALADFNLNPAISNVQNRINRRHYFEAGPDGFPIDDREVHIGNLLDPVSLMVEDRNGDPLELNSIWIANNAAGRRFITSDVEGHTISLVSKYLRNRLTTTLGFRSNSIVSNLYDGFLANSAVTFDPAYPANKRVPLLDESGQVVVTDPAALPHLVLNEDGSVAPNSNSEFVVPTLVSNVTDFTAGNKTIGVVYRANNWMALTLNQADNRSEPNFFQRLLPDGRLSPGSIGRTQDFGIRFLLFQNKVSVNLNYYQSDTENQAYDGRIGSALLNPNRDLWNAFEQVQNLLEMNEGDPRFLDLDELGYRRAEGVNNTVVDTESEGIEARIIANPTKNWRLVFNVSKTLEFGRAGLYDNDLPWVEEQRAAAGALYDAYLAAGDGSAELYRSTLAQVEAGNPNLTESNRSQFQALQNADLANGTNTAEEFILGLHPVDRTFAYVDQEIAVNKLQLEGFGNNLAPMKANLFTSYRFPDGFLKGFTIGGGFNWKDGRLLNRYFNYLNEDGTLTPRPFPEAEFGEIHSITEYSSDDDFRLNVMAAYSMKADFIGLKGSKVKLQLNVDNLLADSYELLPLRYYSNGDIRKYEILGPRAWKLTTSIDF